MWSHEGQWEPATGRMGPLSGQEKFPKSSAQLNGVPGGQGGVETPEVERRPQVVPGGTGRALADYNGNSEHLLAFLGRAQASEVTASLPTVACRGKQGQGSQRVHIVPRVAPVLTPSRAAGGLGVATEETGMVG